MLHSTPWGYLRKVVGDTFIEPSSNGPKASCLVVELAADLDEQVLHPEALRFVRAQRSPSSGESGEVV
jgi:hypothetical protein